MTILGDMRGLKYGRLVVLRMVQEGGPTRCVCRCECGTTDVVVLAQNIRRGLTRSCGCLHKTHGMSKRNPTYLSWCAMIQRCTNPKSERFNDYGGRGIAICARWRESFEAFLADMGERPIGKTLDRKNNAGNYEPGNCQWATKKEQQNNTRANAPVWLQEIIAATFLSGSFSRRELSRFFKFSPQMIGRMRQRSLAPTQYVSPAY